MRRLLPLFLAPTLLLAACLPPPPAKVPETVVPPAQRFAERLGTLPGAVSARQDDTLIVSYPDQTLFASGAALPFPGGRELLDPLSELLLLQPGPWRGTVRVAPDSAAGQEQPLAAARVELLTRYFQRRGLPAGTPELHGEVAAGAPLELRLQPAPPAPPPSPAAPR